MNRDLGPQPLAARLHELGLSHHDLVAASTEQLTHKMVARACKGRWLTPAVRKKVQRALAAAAGRPFELEELFSYGLSDEPAGEAQSQERTSAKAKKDA
jgi:hypothetical protein